MMPKRGKYWAFLLVLTALWACGENEPLNLNFHKDYYPTSIGHWVEYEVDSIRYNDFTEPVTIDTASFFIRHEITDTFRDLNQRLAYRLERRRKNTETSAGRIDAIGQILKTESNVQEELFDLRFIRLTFPPREGETFQGNLYIDTEGNPPYDYLDRFRYDWVHVYQNVHEPYTINGFTFDSTVTVLQIDDENAFEKKYGIEVYAKGVGLVYKELMILDTQNPPNGQPFTERAEAGFIVRYQVVNYAS